MFEQLSHGIALGGVYALIALGYTMVYGIVELINFAHGEVMMLGVFFIYAFSTSQDPQVALSLGLFITGASFCAFETVLRKKMGNTRGIGAAILAAAIMGHIVKTLAQSALSPWLAVPAGIICAGLTGAALERIAYKPLRHAPRLAPLISAIGASLFFQNLAQIIFGTHRQALGWASDLVQYRVAGLPASNVLIFTTAIVTMVILHLFITRTRTGAAMRATAQDRVAASLMGVNVDAVISLTFIIGSSLAALGGLLFTVHEKSLWPYMGFMAGIKAFTAAVLGGIGSIPGAMLGGFLLGIVESLGAGFMEQAGYKDAIAFCLLILVLLFKPTGLMGRRTVVKV